MADAMKPLDWRKPTKHDRDQGGRDSAIWIAPGLGGEYAIQSDLKNFILWRVDDPYAFDTFPTVDAAKAHAEADWQKTLGRKLAASPPAREEAPAEGAGYMTAEKAWADLLEKADRNSPEDSPMLLITWEEMADYMKRAQSQSCAVHADAKHEAPGEEAGDLIEQLCEAMQDGVGCTPWGNSSWDRDGGVSRDLVRDSVRRILNRQAALRNRTSEPEAGAVAWLHTLHMELEQTFSRLTENPQHPFGKPGEDYSEEYRVSTTPLFTHPAPATADKLKVAAFDWIRDDAPTGMQLMMKPGLVSKLVDRLTALNEGGE